MPQLAPTRAVDADREPDAVGVLEGVRCRLQGKGFSARGAGGRRARVVAVVRRRSRVRVRQLACGARWLLLDGRGPMRSHWARANSHQPPGRAVDASAHAPLWLRAAARDFRPAAPSKRLRKRRAMTGNAAPLVRAPGAVPMQRAGLKRDGRADAPRPDGEPARRGGLGGPLAQSERGPRCPG
jgi:hypothetical protein